uniref:Immunoglobulin domain-containing protein n=1 Tax=Scleropages formosus TaxID=113540 RepID=A0A8C9RWD4_SCLFO
MCEWQSSAVGWGEVCIFYLCLCGFSGSALLRVLKAYYIVYILFTTGVQSVWAESSFTAERGGSVTIPCHYDQKYKHHVKYWCKGYHWSTCTIMVRSDSRQSKGDVSINDDPDQLVFTVTMRNLQDKDSGTYWCAVEINGGSDDLKFVPDVVFIVSEEISGSSKVTAFTDAVISSTLLVSLVTLGVLLILLTVVMVTCILQNRQSKISAFCGEITAQWMKRS